jgi:hypothetical protein
MTLEHKLRIAAGHIRDPKKRMDFIVKMMMDRDLLTSTLATRMALVRLEEAK